jgi:H/ACA ribonucleoprotein complex subunit 3
MKHILKCKDCSIYTLEERCPKCGTKTNICIPPKYSPVDKYAEYRRKAKQPERKKAELI